MKKLVAVGIVALAVLGTISISSGSEAAAQSSEVDEALLDAKIDARLHQVLKNTLRKHERELARR